MVKIKYVRDFFYYFKDFIWDNKKYDGIKIVLEVIIGINIYVFGYLCVR